MDAAPTPTFFSSLLDEFAEVSANIRQVPLPREDPVDGKNGRLFSFWRHADLGPG
jgi:uncharacterized protein YjlB